MQRLRERGIASTLVDLRPLHETPDRGPEAAVLVIPNAVYVMSEKAVGTDWRSNSVDTLRHSTSRQKRRLDDALGNAHKSRA